MSVSGGILAHQAAKQDNEISGLFYAFGGVALFVIVTTGTIVGTTVGPH